VLSRLTGAEVSGVRPQRVSRKMGTRIVHAAEHMPDQYRDHLDGYRAVQLVDDDGTIRGELVWRLAGRWHVKFEIKEFGLFADADKRRGRGTQLDAPSREPVYPSRTPADAHPTLPCLRPRPRGVRAGTGPEWKELVP
jgi:hypothetical protein